MEFPPRHGQVRERIGGRWALALLPLVLLAHEAHELAHTVGARLVCGRWPARDFSRWAVGGCDSAWPTALGPLFSFTLMGLAVLLAARGRRASGWVALALMVAANPLARLVTAASGHGDELLVGRMLLGVQDTPWGLHAAVLAVVGVPAVLVMGVAWGLLRGVRARPVAWLVVLAVPMALTGPAALGLNRLIAEGVLATPVAGAPLLVHGVTLLAAAASLVTARWLANPRAAASAPCDRAGTATTC